MSDTVDSDTDTEADVDTNSDTDRYTDEEHPLLEVVGDQSRAVVLAVLLDAEEPLTVTQIAENGGMTRYTVYRNLDPLLNRGAIRVARTLGQSRLFEVPPDTGVGKHIHAIGTTDES